MILSQIISGGQTGADQGGLKAARQLGIPTGGWAPKGWRTECGPAPWLADYGLVEAKVGSYPARTRLNVRHSNGTAIFGRSSVGSRLTQQVCRDLGRPCVVNPPPDWLRQWCIDKGIWILNVAGNRESVHPGIEERVRVVVREAFES